MVEWGTRWLTVVFDAQSDHCCVKPLGTFSAPTVSLNTNQLIWFRPKVLTAVMLCGWEWNSRLCEKFGLRRQHSSLTYCWTSTFETETSPTLQTLRVSHHHHHHHHHQEQAPCWTIAISTVCRHCLRFCARFQAVCRLIIKIIIIIIIKHAQFPLNGASPRVWDGRRVTSVVTRHWLRNDWSQRSCVAQPHISKSLGGFFNAWLA